MKAWLSGKKKVFGTIASCLVLAIGYREGWDPEVTRSVAWCLMGGVTVEGLIDAFAAYKGRGTDG